MTKINKMLNNPTFWLIAAMIEVALAFDSIRRDDLGYAFFDIVFFLLYMYFRQT